MSQFSKVLCSTALIYGISAPLAHADVTNAEVWDNWRSFMEGMGYEVVSSTDSAGDTLNITNITMSFAPVPDGQDVSITMPGLTMTELGDGTVRISLEPLTQLSVAFSPDGDNTIEATIDYVQDGLDMIVSGDVDKMQYTYSANSVTASLASIKVDGTDLGNDLAKATVSLADINGTTLIDSGDLRTVTQTAQSGPLTYDLAFNDPESSSAITLKGGLQGTSTTNAYNIPTVDVDMQDMNAMLAAGFVMDGALTYTGGNMDMSFNGPTGAGTAQTSSAGGSLEFSMSSDGLSYDVGQNGLAVNALMPDLPIPISMEMAEAGFNLSMPVQKSNEEQDFAFGFTMGDFTVSDLLWGMLDPSAQLPRDPATIALDMTGKAKILFDFMDPAQAAALESSGAAPGEVNSLTLNKILVDAVGARLSGTGDFNFDNSDKVTFGGMPRPEGAVDLQLVGGNGLIDKLVAMGLLPEQQAMGARMMMGLFAVPGEGEDTLNSKIEINDQGHILANGQRIQ